MLVIRSVTGEKITLLLEALSPVSAAHICKLAPKKVPQTLGLGTQ